jgi:hypothetical protein
MVIHEGEEWLTLAEVAEAAGVPKSRVDYAYRREGLLAKLIFTPRRGRPSLYVRRAEADRWRAAHEAARPKKFDIPDHMSQVVINAEMAARVACVPRQWLYRAISEGHLKACDVARLGYCVRLTDLADWRANHGHTRRLDLEVLRDLEAWLAPGDAA